MKKLLAAALLASLASVANAGEKNRPKFQENGYGLGIYRLAVTPVDKISKPWCYYCPTRRDFGSGMRIRLYPSENGIFAQADLIKIRKFDPFEDRTAVEYSFPLYGGYQHAIGDSPLGFMFGAGLVRTEEYDYTARKISGTFRPTGMAGIKASMPIRNNVRGFSPRSVDIEISYAYLRHKYMGSDKFHDGGNHFMQMNIGATFRRRR